MPVKLLHGDVTDRIIQSYYHVYNALGPGFLERVYVKSLTISLQASGLQVQTHFPIQVHFEGHQVGEYFADLFVNSCVIIEVKAAESLHSSHEAQLLNYLKATTVEVGLLFNFGGQRPEFRRKLLTNDSKPHLKNP